MFKEMEDILDGIKDFLDTDGNLENQLQAIESARGVTIPRWELMDTSEIQDAAQLKIEILPDKTVPDYGDSGVQPVIGDHFNIHRVDIFVYYSGTITKPVNRALLRYGEAINKLIRTDERFGNRFNWVKIREIDYSPMIDATAEILKICTISLEVQD